VEHGSVQDAGTFIYTFHVPDKHLRIMPRTYEEFILYIDAKRRAMRGSEWDRLSEGGDKEEGGIVE